MEVILDCDYFYIRHSSESFQNYCWLEFWSKPISHGPESHCNQGDKHSCVSANCATVYPNRE